MVTLRPQNCVYTAKRTEPVAENDIEAMVLWREGWEPICPECGRGGFPTNFTAVDFGGEPDDNSIIWFCRDMGATAFIVLPETKWKEKK